MIDVILREQIELASFGFIDLLRQMAGNIFRSGI